MMPVEYPPRERYTAALTDLAEIVSVCKRLQESEHPFIVNGATRMVAISQELLEILSGDSDAWWSDPTDFQSPSP